MCLSPVTVCSKNKDYGLNTGKPSYAWNYYTVPCGKCVECLERRQRVISSRIASMCKKNPLVHFVTLTYSDAALPIAMSLRCVSHDVETGEEVVTYSPQAEMRFTDNEVLRGKVLKLRPSSRPRVVYVPLDDVNNFLAGEDLQYSYVLTPSLRRKDVRDWIKRNRMRYERSGKPLNFAYTFIGELGPNTARPHYHLLFFGLSREQVNVFCADWQKEFGFTFVEQVMASIADYSKVGNYIGKYCSKGSKYEANTIVEGLCEKPRICQSLGFGSFITDSLRDWYHGVDVVGAYDFNTLIRPNGLPLSQSELDTAIDVINRRQYIDFQGQKYPIAQSLKQVIYGYYSKTSGKVERNKVYALAMDVARVEYTHRNEESFNELARKMPGKSAVEAVAVESARLSISALQAESRFDKNMRRFKEKSVF